MNLTKFLKEEPPPREVNFFASKHIYFDDTSEECSTNTSRRIYIYQDVNIHIISDYNRLIHKTPKSGEKKTSLWANNFYLFRSRGWGLQYCPAYVWQARKQKLHKTIPKYVDIYSDFKITNCHVHSDRRAEMCGRSLFHCFSCISLSLNLI